MIDRQPITVYLDRKDKERVERLAKVNERTVSAEARRILRKGLNGPGK